MLVAAGIVCLLLGLLGYVGQLISTASFPLAQRLGLQEANAETEPLYRQLELNTARWDLLVLWTLPVAGVLMILRHPWWPYLALVGGAVQADAAGREVAKILGLRKHDVKTGSAREARLTLGFHGVMLLVGLGCVGLAFASLI